MTHIQRRATNISCFLLGLGLGYWLGMASKQILVWMVTLATFGVGG